MQLCSYFSTDSIICFRVNVYMLLDDLNPNDIMKYYFSFVQAHQILSDGNFLKYVKILQAVKLSKIGSILFSLAFCQGIHRL